MPIHDWTRTFAGIFHDFHQTWCLRIKERLNAGLLPSDHYALVDQVAVGVEPDVVTLQDRADEPDTSGGTRFVTELGKFPPRRKNTVAVKHVSDDRVVAVIEILSPGNKESSRALRSFVDKTIDLMAKGIHLLVIDLYPPTPRDPHGIHSVIQEELIGTEFIPPPDEPLTVVAYEADIPPRAHIEPVKVGAVLPDMPVFLRPGQCVVLPLEETYTSAYEAVPLRWRKVIDASTN